MAPRHPLLRSALPAAGVVAGVALLVRLVYAPWYLNYDSRYALVWARDLWRGFAPEYTAPFAPTPHPLWNAVASLTLPFGDSADAALAWLVMLCFGALVWLTYRLGGELFGRWVGVVAALVVLTRPAIERDVLLGYLDVAFAALVVGAVLLEARRPRRGTAVLAVLALAGMLRPEAWVLAGAYFAYLWPRQTARGRARLAALAALGPLVWLGSDALITGDPLHSLHGTAALADEADRRRSPSQVPYWTAQYFGYTLRSPVVAGIAVGLLFAWRRGLRAARLPLAVAALLVAVFAIGPLFGLPLIGRYVRTPSVLLALFFGLAVAGATTLAPSRERRRWALAGLAVLGLSLAYVPRHAELVDSLLTQRQRSGIFYSDLRAIARAPAVRAAFAACPRATASDHRPVPYLRWWLGGDPGSVSTVEDGASRPGRLWLAPRHTRPARLFYRESFPRARPPAGYVEIARNRTWQMLADPACRRA